MQPKNDLETFAETATAYEIAVLLRMAAAALREGVHPETVADRIEAAMRGGYGHVSYNAEALASDTEDLGAA